MNKLKLSAIVCISILITACTSVPLSTMWKLRNFDPLQADPSQIRIAVITDKIVQLKDDAVTMELSFTSEFPEHTFKNISNATVKTNSSVQELDSKLSDNERITLFYLDKETADQMRLAQNRIRISKQNEIKGDGSFSVNVNTGCFDGPKPKELKANIYAQFDSNKGYIKMISDLDLLSQIDQGEFWYECDAAADKASKDSSPL